MLNPTPIRLSYSFYFNPLKCKTMKIVKSVLASLVGAVAFILLLAEIDTHPIAFFAYKFASITCLAWCALVIKRCNIIKLDD